MARRARDEFTALTRKRGLKEEEEEEEEGRSRDLWWVATLCNICTDAMRCDAMALFTPPPLTAPPPRIRGASYESQLSLSARLWWGTRQTTRRGGLTDCNGLVHCPALLYRLCTLTFEVLLIPRGLRYGRLVGSPIL